jgi:hypothetical protein
VDLAAVGRLRARRQDREGDRERQDRRDNKNSGGAYLPANSVFVA